MKKSPKQILKEKCVKKATENKLEETPYCVFCGQLASTCHHFVHQARSNYLRCDSRNLIPICKICHCKLHNGYEPIMALQLRNMFGEEWAEGLLRDSQKSICDTMGHWKEVFKELNN